MHELTAIRVQLEGERDSLAAELADTRDALKEAQARLDAANAALSQLRSEMDHRLREKDEEIDSIRCGELGWQGRRRGAGGEAPGGGGRGGAGGAGGGGETEYKEYKGSLRGSVIPGCPGKACPEIAPDHKTSCLFLLSCEKLQLLFFSTAERAAREPWMSCNAQSLKSRPNTRQSCHA